MAGSADAFPFRRNTKIDPYAPVVTAPGTPLAPMAIDRALHEAEKVSTFEWTNPLDCWVWLRGWNGTAEQAPAIMEMGHLLGPGAQTVKSSQTPDFIAAVAMDTPEKPIFASGGAFKFAGRKTYLLYGGGG